MTVFPGQDRLIRRESLVGFLNERTFPEGHIGSQFADWKNVDTDDFIFYYVQENATGLAPARAEDAEAEMAYKEETFGEGRARIQDWSLKDHYTSSDVTRYREFSALIQAFRTGGLNPANFPLTVGNDLAASFEQKIVRDTALRQQKLMNRHEWLIMQALWNNRITYDDGNLSFDVSYNRPDAQGSASATVMWDQAGADPIGDIWNWQQQQFDLYGTSLARAVISRRILMHIWNSDRFAAARTGLAVAGGPSAGVIDPRYFAGWSPDKALELVSQATGIQFQVYDSVYRTRDRGAVSLKNHRFSPDDKVLFLPSQADVDALDDSEIGFGKMCSAPHPANNFQSGWYAWEKDLGQDPWGYDFGTGVKMFPVFPHQDLTVVAKVIGNGTTSQAQF